MPFYRTALSIFATLGSCLEFGHLSCHAQILSKLCKSSVPTVNFKLRLSFGCCLIQEKLAIHFRIVVWESNNNHSISKHCPMYSRIYSNVYFTRGMQWIFHWYLNFSRILRQFISVKAVLSLKGKIVTTKYYSFLYCKPQD